MKEQSIWSEVTLKSFPSLESDVETHVLIVGGGIAGLLTAYQLQENNIPYILVEQDKIGNGISKNTTSFLTISHDYLYQDMIKDLGILKASVYLNLNAKAIEEYKKLSFKYDFDFYECSNILYSNYSTSIIKKEIEALNTLLVDTKVINKLPFDFNIKMGCKINNQAIIHPLKFIDCISRDLNIYEHTRIENVKENTAFTKHHKITFNKIIFATNFPCINKFGFYFTKLTQRRSYVVALKNNIKINDMYTCLDNNGLYIRKYKDYLIVGGYDRDTKKRCLVDFVNLVKDKFPNMEIAYSWSNQDCVSLDKIPYIGRLDHRHKDYYVITGFNLYGFTWAMSGSLLLLDMLKGNEANSLVNPLRKIKMKPLFVNIFNYLKNLASFKKPRCSHMGSALIYNEVDHVYECPCHGSRFLKNGKVINGPAKKNIKK